MRPHQDRKHSMMNGNRRLALLLSLVVLVLAATTRIAVAQDSTFWPEKEAQIQSAVSKFLASSHAPGISVALVENGELVWSSGFGFADLENHVPATAATLYRLGSISKPITATGAMQLWERKKLDLDAPLQKYCPAFPKKEWPITTRELLGHLGGIRHYKSGSQDDPEIGNTRHFDDPIIAGLNFFEYDALVSSPGTHFHYSTQGYTLVGCVMEGASGVKYTDFMLQNVIVPAGMDHTQVDDRFAIIPYRTRFYQKTETGAVLNADFLDSSYKIPGGGWLSSAEDMAHFEVAILNDKLIRRATRDLAWTPLKPSDGSEDKYGLGFGSSTEDGIRFIGHSGGQQGTSTDFLLAPDRFAGVVVLANMEGVSANDLAKEIMKIILAKLPDEKKK